MKDFKNSILNICEYEVWVSLGCTDAERSFQQPVHFDLEIEFENMLIGELTDQLKDAIDYVTLTDLIKKSAQMRSYHLIESLCYDATENVVKFLNEKNIKGVMKLKVLKPRAPVPYLKSGVSWTCQRHLL